MSITVSFSTGSKKQKSTKQLTMSVTHDCVFKSGCSMLKPILLLEITSGTYPNYTAFKIEDRYYRVTDIVSVRNNIFEIHGEIDALATAKSYIINSTQYVCYSSLHGDPWLADTRIPVLKNTQASQSSAGMSFIDTDGIYILSVVGGDIVGGTGVGGCEIFALNKSGLNRLIQNISTWESTGFTDAVSHIQQPTASYAGTTHYVVPAGDSLTDCMQTLVDTVYSAANALGDTIVDIQDALSTVLATAEEAAVETGFVGNAYANAPNCIRSCIWVPFDINVFTGSSGVIYLGNFNTGEAGFKVDPKPKTGTITVNIPWHYSDWRRGYCEDVYLYLPFVGMVNYDANSLTHVTSISVKWSATATDGNVCYEVTAGNEILGTYGGNCSTNYPIGINQQASAGDVFTAIAQGTKDTISSLIDSTISPLSAAGAIAGFAATAAVSAYNVENVEKSTHFSCIGGIGGGAGCGLGLDVVCYTVSHDTIVAPSDMKDTMGLPTMKPMSLSTLTGYCKCANAHVDAPLTETELAIIDACLNSGFYIE